MAISFFNIKKWFKMLTGNSVYHVKQDEGKYYRKDQINGYYNNLTEKVSKFGEEGLSLPKVDVGTGEEIYLPTAVFQYGLGAYDLYLESKDEIMRERMIVCSNWALDNQESNGGWRVFEYENKEQPYSSMTQGEGASLLLRAYKETGDEKYFTGAKKAVYFMIIPIEEGGTAKYLDDDIYLYEYTYAPLILNGWIFSYWGLRDYCIVSSDKEILNICHKTLETMVRKLPEFDLGYWSKYDDGKIICSPFYHNLHIAQMKVMFDLTRIEIFNHYAVLWEGYKKNRWNRIKALLIKCYQKIFE